MWEAVSSSPLSTYSVSCILQSPRQRQTADGRCAFGADVACCAAAVTHRIVLLFQEEVKKGQMVTSVIGRLANYDGGTIPNTELESVEDEVSEKGGKKKATQKVRTSQHGHALTSENTCCSHCGSIGVDHCRFGNRPGASYIFFDKLPILHIHLDVSLIAPT